MHCNGHFCTQVWKLQSFLVSSFSSKTSARTCRGSSWTRSASWRGWSSFSDFTFPSSGSKSFSFDSVWPTSNFRFRGGITPIKVTKVSWHDSSIARMEEWANMTYLQTAASFMAHFSAEKNQAFILLGVCIAQRWPYLLLSWVRKPPFPNIFSEENQWRW